MKRDSLVILLALVLSACSGQASAPAAPGQSSAAAGAAGGTGGGASTGGGGSSSIADAASKVKDVCTLLPTDLAGKLVPGGSAPQSQLFPPLKCTVSNQISVLELTLFPGASTSPVAGAEQISGVATDAYLERPLPDDAYLTVILSRDPDAVLYVEVAGHDGKDHKQDAIDVANAVIAKLQ